MGRVDRIAMWQTVGHVFRQVQKQIATLRRAEQLHADADTEHGHPPPGDQVDQPTIHLFATIGQSSHGRMQHEPVTSRVEIGPANHDNPLDEIEQAAQVVVIDQRGNHQRHASRPCDGVVISGANIGKRGRIPLGLAKICIQSDQRFHSHDLSFFSTFMCQTKVKRNGRFEGRDSRCSLREQVACRTVVARFANNSFRSRSDQRLSRSPAERRSNERGSDRHERSTRRDGLDERAITSCGGSAGASRPIRGSVTRSDVRILSPRNSLRLFRCHPESKKGKPSETVLIWLRSSSKLHILRVNRAKPQDSVFAGERLRLAARY